MRRRYVQKQQPDGSFKLVEVTGNRSVGSAGPSVFAQPDVAFRSPVDGSIVTSQRALAEHNKRNNVIHESEMGSAKDRENFYGRKAAERADLYEGTAHTAYGKGLQRERRQTIADAINEVERRHDR